MMTSQMLRPAVERLAKDGFVAYPTETVWGLGACADRPLAVERLKAWKGRAAETPMSVLVSSAEAAGSLGCEIDGAARRLIDAFWPGPLTVVVPCSAPFAPGVRNSEGALGLRCSTHPVAQALAIAVGAAGLGPLTSTSLNRSGEPPALDLADARSILGCEGGDDPEQPLLVSETDCDAGGAAPSSIVDCTGESPRVLRIGAIESTRLEEVWASDDEANSGEKTR